MKFSTLAFTLLASALPILASASFSGKWSGTGGANYGGGGSAACEQVSFQFNQGFTSFEILSGRAICSGVVYNFPTGVLTAENGVLKDRGLAVGMIGPDFFHISYSYRPGTLNILDIRMSGKNAVSVTHTAGDANIGSTNELRATLNAQKK